MRAILVGGVWAVVGSLAGLLLAIIPCWPNTLLPVLSATCLGAAMGGWMELRDLWTK